MSDHNHHNRSSILLPAILILVGLAFLFQNLGLLGTPDLWNNLFKFWPLLLILLGINDMAQNKGIVGPTMSIGIGAIFMAANLGYLGWDSWMTIWRLWPVVIIAIGLEIFLGRKNIALSMFGVALSLALLGGGLYLSGGINGVDSSLPVGEVITGQDIEQPLDDAESANVRIDSPVGELTVEALNGSKNLIEGTIYSVERETILESYEMDGDMIDYYLHSDWTSGGVNFNDKNQRLSWNLALTNAIPLDLNISLGMGKSTLDLSDLQVSKLDLNIDIGQTTVTLPGGEYQARVDGGVGQTSIEIPAEGQIQLNVDGGVGEIVIYFPEDMAAKINVDRGVAGLSVPAGFEKNDSTYTTPNFDSADNWVEISIDQGVGNIAIRH